MYSFYTKYSKTELIGKATACGGNWTRMLITGIKACAPELYDALPDVSYDFVTIAQLVNVLCTDNEADYESMSDAFKKMDADHEYWLRCVQRAYGICRDSRDSQMLAYLWMFKRICLDKGLLNDQLIKLGDYLAAFEQYVQSKDGFLEPMEE